MAELPKSASAVVVGGGVMGASAAYHLATRDVSGVVLVERDTLGSGATSKSAGGFRAQFSDELNIRIALENIRRLAVFEEEFKTDIDFKQWGYLFLLKEDAVESFETGIALQQSLGVPSELITPDDAAAMVPGIEIGDLAAAAFCSLDGYCTPEAVVQGYARAASELGAQVVQGVAALEVQAVDGRIVGVATSHGFISTGVVVLTAGVWTRDLALPLGLDLPVQAEKRHVFLTEPGDLLPRQLPLTIDFDTGFYFQREGNGLLLGGRQTSLEALAGEAVLRLPVVSELGVRPGWWGYYAMSPDHNAIIGSAQAPAGLFYATGFSGHGFQQGPVVGEYLADLVVGREPKFDLAAFSVDRFERGGPRPERNVV